jgi:streptogramin lyase
MLFASWLRTLRPQRVPRRAKRNRHSTRKGTAFWPRPLNIEQLENRLLLDSTQIVEYSIPTANSQPNQIIVANGDVWFNEVGAGKIARVTSAGAITEFQAPGQDSPTTGVICAGPDGIWFSGPHEIGEIAFDGTTVLREFSIPSAPAGNPGIPGVLGPDGNIWYTEPYGSPIVGRLTPQGQITETLFHNSESA